LLQEKTQKKGGTDTSGILKDIENELGGDLIDKSLLDSEKDIIGKKTSYYVEENEKLLNLLITNCEPILSEMVSQVNHFNSYNKIQRVIEKSG
jgi:hypothetical protein